MKTKWYEKSLGEIFSSNSKRSKKKSYNPFKMWGSYVGLLIGITLLPDLFSTQLDLMSSAPLLLIMFWLIGFLIGYGIHSLFRRFKK